MRISLGALLVFSLSCGFAAAEPVATGAPVAPIPDSDTVRPLPPPPPKPKPKPRPASFTCRDAFEQAEKLICKSFPLAKLDQQMFRAYNDYMDSLGGDQGLAAQSVELAQRRFVIERNRCYESGCIRAVYEDRIRVLHGQTSNNMGLRR